MSNPFFKNNGPIKLSEILENLNLKKNDLEKNLVINDIKDLINSTENDITFFHSKKYKDIIKKTKAVLCLTTESMKEELPKSCTPIIVKKCFSFHIKSCFNVLSRIYK